MVSSKPPDSHVREIHHKYRDPLDQIWIATAEVLGLQLERSPDHFAHTDGNGTLYIARPKLSMPMTAWLR